MLLLHLLAVPVMADHNGATDRIITDIMKVQSFLLTILFLIRLTEYCLAVQDYKADVRPVGGVTGRGVTVGIKIVPLHLTVDPETSTLRSHVW